LLAADRHLKKDMNGEDISDPDFHPENDQTQINEAEI